MAVIDVVKINKEEIPPVLTTKCEFIKDVNSKDTQQIIENLLDTVKLPKNNAAGLSAPQIGISKRIFVVRKFSKKSDDDVLGDYVMINPEITSFSNQTDIRWEACLSIPDTFGRVQRSKQIKILYTNEKGEKCKLKANGFFARAIQHEMDHLDGVLFTTKVIGETMTEAELDKMMREEHKEM